MLLSTDTLLPYAKTSKPPLVLEHDLVDLTNSQRRLVDRQVLMPEIDLDAYRFRAVIDWIELRLELGRPTQAQYVQRVLRQHLNRNSHIRPENEGPGSVATVFQIKIQEPISLALVGPYNDRDAFTPLMTFAR